MAFRGLFVGINRYASPDIQELRAAANDARALHALFSDTLGEGAELLIDDEATRGAIDSRFVDLATCHSDDVVIVAFSGHGSPTHELVTYDADLASLATTAIPLDTLTDWFARIPARRLVCILDCCFSGGLGAKVLVLDHAPRSVESAEAVLKRLAGEGRLILTASLATEEAFEHHKLRHGLLTYFVIEALQGAEGISHEGVVSVYQLLDYVSKQVIAAADRFGKPQHPTLRGTIDGSFHWPVFRRGSRYEAAFPGSTKPPVTPDLASLVAYGFPPQLFNAWSAPTATLRRKEYAILGGMEDGHASVGRRRR